MEYTMIVALIGMGLVVMLSVIGGVVQNTYQRTSASVSRQTTGAGGGGGGGGSGPVLTSLHPAPVPPSEPPDSTGEGDSSDSAATTHASSH
jgi:Flp pilus assembly pilin Flp